MSNSHFIDYIVITAADVTALFLGWLAGKGWFERKAKEISNINWQRSGHLYWLSSDLMWTWMQASNGNVPRMIHGLNKSVHHATAIGLNDSILSRLKAMQAAVGSKTNLTPSERQEHIQELDAIISEVGKLAVGNQPDFRADP
jgi:hypothetical protein